MIKRLSLFIVAGCCVLALPMRAQTGAQQSQTPVFRSAAEVVRFDVMVTDGRTPVTNLTAADFEVIDNGVVQRVDLATTAGSVAVAMAPDVSGSMENNDALKDLVNGCQAVVDALGGDDRAWLVTFSDQFALRTTPAGARDDIRLALEGVRARAGTSLWDALF